MPHRFRYNWVGDDGAARSRAITLHDDGRIEVEGADVRRRLSTDDPATTAEKANRHRSRIADYAAAEASLFAHGPVSDDVFASRTGPDGCGSCVRRRESRRDPIGFCGECGCGTAPRAALTVKARMPAATCPLDPPRWGPAPGQGADALDRIRQLGGVAAQFIDHITRGRRGRAKDHHG